MPLLHRPRRRTVATALVTAVLVAGGGAAVAATAQPAIHTSTPKRAADITNIDVLRQQIANYYGDPLKTGVIGAHSRYTKEVRGVEHRVEAVLAAQQHARGAKKAIVLDVDDTTLATWNYEVQSNWDYDPATNAASVTGQRFPAVPGMVHLVDEAKARGYAVFFITGRPSSQEAATLGNLTADHVGVDAGYPAPTDPDGTGPEDGLYTKPALTAYPKYLKQACGTDACTTVEYKAATRRHIKWHGYTIVADIGDQYSDLTGGTGGRTFKLPNPNYYLP
jgi:hypothetical protein